MKNQIPYNPKLKTLARKLRNNSTKSEIILWNSLKRKQMLGYTFTRQKPLGNYIVDFFCKELSLAIEIDGETHIGREKEDLKRQTELEELGVNFLRFYDADVYKNLSGVLRTIEVWIENERAEV